LARLLFREGGQEGISSTRIDFQLRTNDADTNGLKI